MANLQKKARLKFRPVEKIPAGFLEGFSKEVHAKGEYMDQFVSGAAMKIGAFYDGALAGFFTAIPHSAAEKGVPEKMRGFLEVTSAYVAPGYRRKRIMHKGLFLLVSKAKAMGLKGAFLWGMMNPTIRYFRKQAVRPRRAIDSLVFNAFFDPEMKCVHGRIEFPQKAGFSQKMPAARKKRALKQRVKKPRVKIF